MLPADCRHHRTYVFDFGDDFNGDGKPDQMWVVFYRFDLPEQGDESRAPICGALYQLDSQRPPAMTKHDLVLPDGTHLCECDCRARREELISRSEGEELLITDHCNGVVTRLIVYRWVPERYTYEYVDFFEGDRIQWEKDHVTVERRLPPVHPLARSQMAERTVYVIQGDGEGGWAWVENRKEVICITGVPCTPTYSPYPEKVVLALYTHYTDTFEIRSYFTDAGWERVGGCWNGQCGCRVSREQVEHVRVVELQLGQSPLQEEAVEESTPLPEGVSPAELPPPVEGEEAPMFSEGIATVMASVVCEPACADEEPILVVWTLVHEGHRWLLDNAEVVGPMPLEGSPPAP